MCCSTSRVSLSWACTQFVGKSWITRTMHFTDSSWYPPQGNPHGDSKKETQTKKKKTPYVYHTIYLRVVFQTSKFPHPKWECGIPYAPIIFRCGNLEFSKISHWNSYGKTRVAVVTWHTPIPLDGRLAELACTGHPRPVCRKNIFLVGPRWSVWMSSCTPRWYELPTRKMTWLLAKLFSHLLSFYYSAYPSAHYWL